MKKDSFILYLEHFDSIDELSTEECGQLLKGIINHLKGNVQPHNDSTVAVKCVLSFITKQLDRDRIKYEEMCERNAVNCNLGGRPKKEKQPQGAEEYKLQSFLKEHTHINTGFNVTDFSNIDFVALDKAIKESEYLSNVHSLKFFVDNYDKIISGYYKTFLIKK